MPGKARRIASRQSQLNQRRKKQQRGPRGIPAAITSRPSTNGETASSQIPESARPTPAVATADRPAPAPARPSPVARSSASPRNRREPSNTARYVGAEIKRILALAGAVVAVIVALTFVV